MKIIYKIGDVTEAEEPTILHGCNAQGRMNSGVAKAIREKFPEAYEIYKIYETKIGLSLGMVCGNRSKNKFILNAITQDQDGKDRKRYVCYEAVATALERINCTFDFCNKPRIIAMPKIGAGLGGGNWKIISTIIEETLTDIQPVVYTMEDEAL
jgi:O-acetyl-ADP-ribose deacetylase (regulator of RNase III)